MQREMRFREMMYCNLAATVLAGALGVALAYSGAGLWSLVAYHFGQIVAACLATFLVLRWIPHGRFSAESARRLGGFGLKMLLASVITNLYNSLRPLIIGRRYSTEDLGYYDRGQKFSTTVSMNLDAAIRSVMFPVLSRSQDESEQFLAILRRMKKIGCFLIFPVMFGMAAVAEPLIRLLLKEQWLPAAPYLVLLSCAEAQVPLTSSNLVALKSLGRSDLYSRQELLRRALMLIVLLISVFAFDTALAIAVSFLISAWIDVAYQRLCLRHGAGHRGELSDLRVDRRLGHVPAAENAAGLRLCRSAPGRLEIRPCRRRHGRGRMGARASSALPRAAADYADHARRGALPRPEPANEK